MPEQQRMSFVLLEEADDREVLVSRKNEDRFVISAEEAVAACFAFAELKHVRKQFQSLLAKLHAWLEGRRDRAKAAYLTVREKGDLLFLVMQKQVQFDPTLTEDLAELDIEIANDPEHDLLHMDVLAIPAVSRESADAFLSSGRIYTHA